MTLVPLCGAQRGLRQGRRVICFTLATVGVAAAPLPAGALGTEKKADVWSASSMSSARYIILPPRIEGNPDGITAHQRKVVLRSMRHDLAGSLKRRYPEAIVVTAPEGHDVVRVTPVITTPKVLLPWGQLGLKLIFERKSGEQLLLKKQFSLLSLWNQQDDAATYAYDKLIKQLP